MVISTKSRKDRPKRQTRRGDEGGGRKKALLTVIARPSVSHLLRLRFLVVIWFFLVFLLPLMTGQFKPEETATHVTHEHMKKMFSTTRPVNNRTEPGDVILLQQQEQQPPKEVNASSSAMYAYAFVVGGIHEDRPSYKGFLYGVMVSVSMLRRLGSKADFWLWSQLSPDSTLESLPAEDMRVLTALGIHVEQLDKHPEHESFAHIVYEKFRPLQMTQYRRVMFLDADTMPLLNLDYLFHLSDSDSPILRPNLIMASRQEPCNAGLFILHPEPGEWDRVQQIIDRQHEEGSKMPYPHFDWKYGWGHSFAEERDYWEGIEKKGNRWRFHAGHSDQGLLYYYVKYVRQDVSIVIGDRIQNWMPDEDTGKPQMVKEFRDLDKHAPKPIAYQWGCGVARYGDDELKWRASEEYQKWRHMCFPINRDFVHFFGKEKPWQNSVRSYFQRTQTGDIRTWKHNNDQNAKRAAYRLWWIELANINEKYKMGLDIENWDQNHPELMKESPLGYMAMYVDHQKVIKHKKNLTGLVEEDSPPAKTNQEAPPSPQSTLPLPRNIDISSKSIAYAISFIKCGDFQTHSAGLTDASLVLRHSVDKIHKDSKYDYKMYAIVHRQAEACSQVLRETGFEVMLVDPPVRQDEIRGPYLKKMIHREWCCGSDEFIKLYAYVIPHEVIVHVDIDFAFYKPMDHLFDSLLYDKDTPEGMAARSKIELERPTDKLPDRIGAFITRDWPQVAPTRFPPAYQAGFLVARRDPSVLEELVPIIKEGNYSEGWGWSSGWGGKGYGGYVGAMAMQGLIGYYYDHVRRNNAVELNQCRFNHMGMDVRYNKPPNFAKRYAVSGVGACRNDLPDCEDCMKTEFEKIYSVHYTMCRKPWQCQATGLSGGKKPGGPRATAINIDTVDLDHCLGLVKQWHSLRTDLENQLYGLTKDESIKNGTTGTYKPEIFEGHCDGDGNDHYKLLAGSSETFKRVQELYTSR